MSSCYHLLNEAKYRKYGIPVNKISRGHNYEIMEFPFYATKNTAVLMQIK